MNVVIIGATSAIAKAYARICIHRGDALYLIARNENHLLATVKDLKVRGATSIDYCQLDVIDFKLHEEIIDQVFNIMKVVDVILIAHGSLPSQKACENDFNTTLMEINTNAMGTISLLTHIANKMEYQETGSIVVITSVAGERGRQSNYVYGSAKGMISIFLQGLRNRLNKSGISVIDIKPGFVDTPMTSEFDKGCIWATPEKIAKDISSSINKKSEVVYTPWFWRYIMFFIRLIPESIFKRLKL